MVMEDNTCKMDGCDRPIKAGGMCRYHRGKHLDATMHEIGPAKQRAIELINHYGTIGFAARVVGVSRNTLVRVRHADVSERMQSAAYNRIMNHQPEQPPTPRTPASQGDPITGAEVAAYALTKEGQAFIKQCQAPKEPRAVA